MVDSVLSSLVAVHSLEVLLQLNTYFHFGFSLSPGAFSAADLSRLIGSPSSRKLSILLHTLGTSVTTEEILHMFEEVGIRDIFSPKTLSKVVSTVVSKPSDKADVIERGLQDKQFLDLVRVYFE